MSAVRFWGGAAAAAALVAVLARFALPYGALGLEAEAERLRAWLLTVWTVGVLEVLLGLWSLFEVGGRIGVREVVEAGSVRGALERREAAPLPDRRAAGRGFGRWITVTGGFTLLAYFVLWLTIA